MGTNKNFILVILTLILTFACKKGEDFQNEWQETESSANGTFFPINPFADPVSNGPEMISLTPIPYDMADCYSCAFEWTNGEFNPFHGNQEDLPVLFNPNFDKHGIEDNYFYFDYVGNTFYSQGFPTAITWTVENNLFGEIEIENPNALDLKFPLIYGITTCNASITFETGIEINIEFSVTGSSNFDSSFEAEIYADSNGVLTAVDYYHIGNPIMIGNGLFYSTFDTDIPVAFNMELLGEELGSKTMYLDYLGNSTYSQGFPTDITWEVKRVMPSGNELILSLEEPNSYDLYFPGNVGTYNLTANLTFESGVQEAYGLCVQIQLISYSLCSGTEGELSVSVPGGGGSKVAVFYPDDVVSENGDE